MVANLFPLPEISSFPAPPDENERIKRQDFLPESSKPALEFFLGVRYDDTKTSFKRLEI
jgi:hypothetical protein